MSVWKYKDPDTGEVKKVGYASALTQGMQMELLWENASPASVFAPQTISLDLSQYDAVFCVFNVSKDWGQAVSTGGSQLIEVGKNAYCFGSYKDMFYSRSCETAQTGIKFNGAYYWQYGYAGNAVSNIDSLFVPLRIYGVKGVS